MRKLTKFFGSYRLAKYQKANKVNLMQLINFDDMDINTLITLIKLGNEDSLTDEQAAEILDTYISNNDGNNYITAYIDILNELDMDIHLFKGFGVDINKIKQDLQAKVGNIENNDNEDLDADLGDIEVEI